MRQIGMRLQLTDNTLILEKPGGPLHQFLSLRRLLLSHDDVTLHLVGSRRGQVGGKILKVTQIGTNDYEAPGFQRPTDGQLDREPASSRKTANENTLRID